MIQLASLGVLFCIVLAAGFLAYLPGAITHDAHLMHKPGECEDCDDDRPDVSWL